MLQRTELDVAVAPRGGATVIDNERPHGSDVRGPCSAIQEAQKVSRATSIDDRHSAITSDRMEVQHFSDSQCRGWIPRAFSLKGLRGQATDSGALKYSQLNLEAQSMIRPLQST